MAKVELNEYEMQLVRFFAKFYTENSEYAPFAAIPGFNEDREKFSQAFDRLARFEFVKGHSSGSLEIVPKCLEAVEQWDNPPMRDRWDEATKKFRSKWWSLPLLLFVAGFPLVKGWTDLVMLVLGWFNPAAKK